MITSPQPLKPISEGSNWRDSEIEREQNGTEVVQTWERVCVCVDCQQLEVSSTGTSNFTDTNVRECLHKQMHMHACTHLICYMHAHITSYRPIIHHASAAVVCILKHAVYKYCSTVKCEFSV